MENTWFFLLYYQDILDRLQEDNQNHYHLVYLKFHPVNSNTYQDDHATSRLHHKVTFETLNDHID